MKLAALLLLPALAAPLVARAPRAEPAETFAAEFLIQRAFESSARVPSARPAEPGPTSDPEPASCPLCGGNYDVHRARIAFIAGVPVRAAALLVTVAL